MATLQSTSPVHSLRDGSMNSKSDFSVTVEMARLDSLYTSEMTEWIGSKISTVSIGSHFHVFREYFGLCEVQVFQRSDSPQCGQPEVGCMNYLETLIYFVVVRSQSTAR